MAVGLLLAGVAMFHDSLAYHALLVGDVVVDCITDADPTVTNRAGAKSNVALTVLLAGFMKVCDLQTNLKFDGVKVNLRFCYAFNQLTSPSSDDTKFSSHAHLWSKHVTFVVNL